MTTLDPRELAIALEEARAAGLDWLEAVRTLARRRAALEAVLARDPRELDHALDGLEVEPASELAA